MAPPEEPVLPDLPRYAAGVRDFGMYHTLVRLAVGPTAEALEDVLRTFHAMMGPDGGPHCSSGRPPVAMVSELVPLRGVLASLGEADRRELRSRVRTYLDERFAKGRATCPLLCDGRCLAGAARPIDCRVTGPETGFASATARSLQFGHRVALNILGLDHHRVDLGAAVAALLDRPGETESYVQGRPAFREEGIFEPNRDPIVEVAKMSTGRREASGFPMKEEAVDLAIFLASEEGVASAVAALSGASPAQQLARLLLPLAYESENEIDEWRDRFARTVREVASVELDPVDAFDALRRHSTFAIPYQGRSDREILKLHGELLIAPIVGRAFPDLVRPIEPRRRSGRIRVGYVGMNVRDHNAGAWSLGWIANHERDMESYVFLTHPAEDAMSGRFRRAADHYFHVPGDVASTARLIKSLELDVLIYPDLGLAGANYQLAGMRLAPLQCTAWGHAVTSGLPTIDYFLSSELMEPEGGDAEYTERPVRLPGSGQFLYRRAPTGSPKTRADHGLPEGFLALVPQALPKMVPRMDALFARISQELPNPLVFFDTVDRACNRTTRARFERADIRVQWLPRMTPYDYRRIVELSDLLIDPPVFNGGMTTLEALDYGKPVVTLPGRFMRGRFGKAFLTQAGMGGLIAKDEDDFVRLVCDREAQVQAVAGANFEGPFGDRQAADGLNRWIRQVVDGS